MDSSQLPGLPSSQYPHWKILLEEAQKQDAQVGYAQSLGDLNLNIQNQLTLGLISAIGCIVFPIITAVLHSPAAAFCTAVLTVFCLAKLVRTQKDLFQFQELIRSQYPNFCLQRGGSTFFPYAQLVANPEVAASQAVPTQSLQPTGPYAGIIPRGSFQQ